MKYIDLVGNCPVDTIAPTTAKANCGSLLVTAWGHVNADKAAAELTMSIEASGLPMGVDGFLRQMQAEQDRANIQGNAFGIKVEHAPM